MKRQEWGGGQDLVLLAEREVSGRKWQGSRSWNVWEEEVGESSVLSCVLEGWHSAPSKYLLNAYVPGTVLGWATCNCKQKLPLTLYR
jgi:hypothetical protein